MIHVLTLASLALVGLLLTVPAGAAPRDGRHDFDFLIGHWHAHLRKLLHPLTGSTTWVEYEGMSETRKIIDDQANLELFSVSGGPADRPKLEGQTLRLYNPDSGQWSIYLLDAAKGRLGLPPVVGSFTDGRGEFLDAEEFDGRAILVRYVWTSTPPDAARIEQSFSADGGRSWESNWICDLARDRP